MPRRGHRDHDRQEHAECHGDDGHDPPRAGEIRAADGGSLGLGDIRPVGFVGVRHASSLRT
jgi:hypothetical protein